MKRFTSVVLMLCIAMMCTTPFEAQSQTRRTGGGTSGNATKKENVQTKSANTSSSTPRRTGSSGSSISSSNTKSSEPKTRMVTPSGQTSRQSAPASRSTQTTTQRKDNNHHNNATKPAAPAQVQDRRTSGTSVGNSRSHSAEISRKHSDVGRQNIPKDRDKDRMANRDNRDKGRYNDPAYNRPPKDRKPSAIQYHNAPPKRQSPLFDRPFVEPKRPPVPSYRYGDHFFGHRINILPRGYVVMRVGNLDYYYYDGIYYRPYWMGGYYVCRPPRGTTIASTLFNVALTAIAINTIRDEIARANRAAKISTVYGNANTGYVVRTSDDYYNNNLAGQLNQEYYYQDGVFYVLRNGQYYVIDAPIGALVTEIPADYDEIELDGRTYYQVEDTIYKTTVIDGALYFEVVCNL